MTLCIAWVRKTTQKEEICLISDSCFSGGQRFLAAPKIFPLERGDCAIACAGDTTYSFPIAEHIRQAISLNQGLRDRSIDFSDFVHSVVDIANKVLAQESEEQKCTVGPGFTMIIAGYSWKMKKPIIQEMLFDAHKKLMRLHTPKSIKKTPFAVIGDHVSEVRHDIFEMLTAEGVTDHDHIDMQPLKVLMKYIEDPAIREIGGHPQMVKIYPFMRVLPYGFIDKDRQIYYFGRPLMHYETFPYPMIDLRTGEQRYMKEINEEFIRKPEPPKSLDKLVDQEHLQLVKSKKKGRK